MNSIALTEPPSSSTLAMSSWARDSISSVSASTKYEPANGSTVSAAPDSWAMTCCVRTAIFAAFSVGSGDLGGLLGGQRERLVEAVGVQRLGAAADRGEALQRHARDVVLRLLGGQRHAAGLRVEAEHERARVLRVEALLHRVRPHVARGAELRDLLEDVVVAVEEERQAGREVVDLQAGVERRLHVRHPARERERDLLHRAAALLAEVVAGDADRVPPGDVLPAVGEQVRGQPHRRPGREDEVPARDVLLEDVVLDGAAQLLA